MRLLCIISKIINHPLEYCSGKVSTDNSKPCYCHICEKFVIVRHVIFMRGYADSHVL